VLGLLEGWVLRAEGDDETHFLASFRRG